MAMIATDGPAGSPTEPGLRARGGSGFVQIGCAASVMPYDSITGAWNAASSSDMTLGGSEAEELRMSRSGFRAITSAFWAARARIAWCIVGTPVYQFGRNASSHSKNLSA